MNARMGSSSGASTVFLSSTDRASLSDGDYASGVQLCMRAQCIIIKRPARLNARPNKYALVAFACTSRERAM